MPPECLANGILVTARRRDQWIAVSNDRFGIVVAVSRRFPITGETITLMTRTWLVTDGKSSKAIAQTFGSMNR